MYSLILHGRRSLELQKWRNLRVLVKILQNVSSFSSSFSSASDALVSPRDGRKRQMVTASYLVDSLGLTLAESMSKKVISQGKGNPDSVLNLLRSHGFTDSQVSSVITDYPLLLIGDAEKSIGPKLKFLQSRGASSSELTEILSKVPKILGMRWDKTISLYYDCVKEIIEADKSCNYVKLCQSLKAEGSPQENKFRNILVLRELGVPQRLLFSLLISKGFLCGKTKFEESLKKVVEMGFDPTTSKFVDAMHVVYCIGDNAVDEKVDILCKSLGLSVGDVLAMFKKCPRFLSLSVKNFVNSIETFLNLGFSRDEFVMMVKRSPQCIKYSTESVKKKTEFVVKKMNWPLKDLVSYPQVFGLSMEKRIVPRCNVIKALISKGLLGDKGSERLRLTSVLVCTDPVFLRRYVKKHDDKKLVAELMSIFTGDLVS